jgi:hypothetical protein
MPEVQGSEAANKAFTWSDAGVAIVGGLIAAPLCDASWHAIVGENETIRGLVGLAFGLPIGIGAFTFHWWKNHLPSVRNWVVQQTNRWWPAVLIGTFVYVVGPHMYRSAIVAIEAPAPIGPIVWNIEDNAKGLGYFINMVETQGHDIRVLGFQAHGKNITDKPIQHLTGYMRSDLTNAQIPIYLLAQEPGSTKIAACFPHPWIPTAPDETYGIPPFAEFNVGTYEKPTLAISPTEGAMDGALLADFKAAFAPFTVVIEYEGGRLERRFSQNEIDRQFSIFEKTNEKTFNPLSSPYVLRRPNARPVDLEPLHSIIPLASPVKPDNSATGTATPKD